MDRSKRILLLIFAISLLLVLGIFVGRISAHNIYNFR